MSQQLSLQTERTDLETKFLKQMGERDFQTFQNKVDGCSKEELETMLLDYAKTLQGIINTKKRDKELERLRVEKNAIQSLYTAQMTGNKDLTRYVALTISDKYGDQLMDEQVPSEQNEGDEE